jgi:hypothetical protein
VAISSYWLNLSLGSASRSSCHIDRVARLSSSEHETTRNLCAAHLLCIKRRNREAGSRLRRPRGVMPERLFYRSRRASSFESDIGKLFSDSPGYGKQMRPVIRQPFKARTGDPSR